MPEERAYILGELLCPECMWAMRAERSIPVWIVQCVNDKCSRRGIEYQVKPSVSLVKLEPK